MRKHLSRAAVLLATSMSAIALAGMPSSAGDHD
jgi:hypothetical protein